MFNGHLKSGPNISTSLTSSPTEPNRMIDP